MTCILVFINSNGYNANVDTNPPLIPAIKCYGGDDDNDNNNNNNDDDDNDDDKNERR